VFLKSQLAAREAMTVQTTSFMRRRILYEGMSYCPLRHNWRMMSLLPCHPHPYLQEGMQVKVVRRPLQGVHGILFPKKSATRLVPGVRIIRQAVAAEIDGRDVWLA
jgi:hypothetical protein